MFANEKSMVDILVKDLQENHGVKYIVREFRGGVSIADVAYTKHIERYDVLFDAYSQAYYYVSIMYKKKKILLSDIEIASKKTEEDFFHFLKLIQEYGYINIEKEYIKTRKEIKAATNDLIAIEAKLSDWKAGFVQAVRYKQYANQSYLAISADHIKDVNKAMLFENGIGLMSVSLDGLEIVLNAQKSKDHKEDIFFYMMDKFLGKILQYSIVA